MVGTSTATRTRLPMPCARIAHPLVAILEELRAVLVSLPPAIYSQPSGETFGRASIGGHVRHCLDHARALVDGRRNGIIDYDHRARGTTIERDVDQAVAEVQRLIEAIGILANVDADEEIGVAIMPTRDGEATVLSSTLARELAFVLSHTIHHNATVRAMAIQVGVVVPDCFGYAPSTLAHKDRAACAR